jgi:hypothetical protein
MRGWYSSGSIPLWMTLTRSGPIAGLAGEDVGAHLLADGDDRVGGFEPGALAEARQRVAAAELLGLPRAEGLETVGGRDVRDVVDELDEMSGEVGVPGVAVDELGASTPAAMARSTDIVRRAERWGAAPLSSVHGS